MKKYGLVCKIRAANPYRRMAKAIKTNHVADNLVKRQFTAYGARRVLLTDITYIPYNGVFCYLSTILDAFTKQILSYVLSESLEAVSYTHLIPEYFTEGYIYLVILKPYDTSHSETFMHHFFIHDFHLLLPLFLYSTLLHRL